MFFRLEAKMDRAGSLYCGAITTSALALATIAAANSSSTGAGKGDNAAESRHRVAFERLFVGLQQTAREGGPTGVGMFDDHGGGRGQVGNIVHKCPCRVGVIKVEVGELHSPVLHHFVPPAALADGAVTRPALVGVLAVAERLRPLQGEVDGGGEGRLVVDRRPSCRLVVQPPDDRGVISSCMGKRLSGQAKPRGVVQCAGLAQPFEDSWIVGRVDDDSYVSPVFSRPP